MCCGNICLGLIAIIFPPFPVWIKRGLCSADSLINIALCFLGVIPGILHSWYIISSTPDDYRYERMQVDPERGGERRTHHRYTYAAQPSSGQPQPRDQPRTYGTNAGPVRSALAEGGNELPPPAYSEAIQGDNKVQGP